MVIDFHTHVFPDRIAAGAVASLERAGSIPARSDGTAAGLIASMRRAGIDLSVNLPVVTKPKQFDGITEFASQINEKHRTGYPILSFAGIHPDDTEAEEHLEQISEMGFIGIKLHPDYQGQFIDSESYIRILAKAKSLGLITVTHSGYDVGFSGLPIKCTPRRVYRALERIGGYDRLVLAHLGANSIYDSTLDVLAGEQVYFDTAFVLGSISDRRLDEIIRKHGEDRILFASDSPWQDQSENLNRIRAFLGVGELCEKILCKNAAALLKINL